MTETGKYQLPDGQLSLSGPISRPATGTLPVRGDLAHVALAERYLVQNYVMPQSRRVGAGGSALLCHPREGSDEVVQLDPDAVLEALDYSGDWCWGCCGPEGPSGYLPVADLAPQTTP